MQQWLITTSLNCFLSENFYLKGLLVSAASKRVLLSYLYGPGKPGKLLYSLIAALIIHICFRISSLSSLCSCLPPPPFFFITCSLKHQLLSQIQVVPQSSNWCGAVDATDTYLLMHPASILNFNPLARSHTWEILSRKLDENPQTLKSNRKQLFYISVTG